MGRDSSPLTLVTKKMEETFGLPVSVYPELYQTQRQKRPFVGWTLNTAVATCCTLIVLCNQPSSNIVLTEKNSIFSLTYHALKSKHCMDTGPYPP